MRTVTNAVPVTKTRTVTHCVPVTRMQTVTKDYGHWEDQVTEVQGCGGYYYGCQRRGGCGGCAGCGQCNGGCSGCGGCGGGYYVPNTTTVCNRVWVPNVKTEQVPVVEQTQKTTEIQYTVYEQHSEQVPVQCSYLVYRPETRTGTKKVVSYQSETRTRMGKKVEYQDQVRTRTSKKLTYRQETRSETYPVISYTQEKRTKEVSYSYRVPEASTENYTVTTHHTVPDVKTGNLHGECPGPRSQDGRGSSLPHGASSCRNNRVPLRWRQCRQRRVRRLWHRQQRLHVWHLSVAAAGRLVVVAAVVAEDSPPSVLRGESKWQEHFGGPALWP